MDNFLNLAKQGIQTYENSHHSQGGGNGDQVQDRRHYEPQAVPHLDHDEVVDQARAHAGNSGGKELFASAMTYLKDKHGEHTQHLPEEHITDSHKEAYQNNNAKNLGASSMGAAAALQAFKMFTASKSSGAGGGGSGQLVSLAMGEAAKLFDSSGGSSSGGKQDVVNHAAATMMKLVVQSKLGNSGIIGGSSSGGLGTLMGIANKFL